MIRHIILFSFTFFLLLLFYLNNAHEWFMMNERIGAMHFVALGIILISLTLTLIFRRSRLFFALLLLLGFAFFAELFDYLRHTQKNLSYRDDVGTLFDFFVLTFLPLSMIALSFFKDRGVITLLGWLRFFVVTVMWVTFVYILTAQVDMLGWFKAQKFLPFDVFNMTDITFMILLSSFVLFIIYAFLKPKTTEWIFLSAFFGLIIAAVLPKTLDHFIILTTFFALLIMVEIISRSYYMAYLDELTELKGRRAMNEALVRLGGQYTLVMGDIDHFKKFNDTYGHDVGDEVLKLVASELVKVKGGGEAYRWGGEEFVLIFPNKEAEQTLDYVEKVRMGIEKHPFYLRDKSRPDEKPKEVQKRLTSPQTLYVTMSFGVASKRKEDLGATEVIKRADGKLYEAKESGRNCVRH